MPCSDLSEIIEITLSPEYKLLDYSLRKLSCDKEIGETGLILDKLQDKTVEEILEINEFEIISKLSEDTDKYLHSKHLQCIKLSLATLIGTESQELCTIDAFEDLGDKFKLKAFISKEGQKSPCAGCEKKC